MVGDVECRNGAAHGDKINEDDDSYQYYPGSVIKEQLVERGAVDAVDVLLRYTSYFCAVKSRGVGGVHRDGSRMSRYSPWINILRWTVETRLPRTY
jgi:hypothetical protein